MLRPLLSTISILGLLSLMAFRLGDPFFDRNPLIYNSTVAHFFHEGSRWAPNLFSNDEDVIEADTLSRPRVLMLDYSSYGSAYNEKIKTIIGRYMPKARITDFSEGTAEDLGRMLPGCDVVVVAYPSAASANAVKAYGNVLSGFARNGGTVLFTGTHEFEILQQFDLFDLDFGYFSKDKPIQQIQANHPVFSGLSNDVILNNFAYPLDISDPGFVTLADVGGYPVIGFKPIGVGKMLYLGIEYYFDEAASSRMLINALAWSRAEESANASAPISPIAEAQKPAASKRSEEHLFAGSGNKTDQIDLKIYPNPYYNKGTLDIELNKPATLMVEMSDEAGRNVALILPKKAVGTGLFRFELPNLSPGIYFIYVQIDKQTYMRKVVKAASN